LKQARGFAISFADRRWPKPAALGSRALLGRTTLALSLRGRELDFHLAVERCLSRDERFDLRADELFRAPVVQGHAGAARQFRNGMV